MRWAKGLFAVVVVAFSLMLIGCLGGGGGSDSGTASPPTTATSPTTADFFHLAIVPNQTVTTPTFEVQVIAENINPTVPPTAPRVIDGSGTSHVMVLKTLKWPGTADDSVTIYSAVIPLVANQVNNIKAVSGVKDINFSIRHKAALSVTTANPGQLAARIQAAMADPSIDVVEVNYAETDLGSAIHNVGNGFINNRTTWLTIRPSSTGSILWERDFGATSSFNRPMVDFLHLHQVKFGDDSSDYGAGLLYVEPLHRVWLSEAEFRAKYKHTVLKTTAMAPVDAQSDVRIILTEGQRVYYTDCLWDGTASTAATFGVALARDLRFNSHRGDINDFGKVVLNVLANNLAPISKNPGGGGYNPADPFLHNDGFQIFASTNTTDIVFKGFKVLSPNIQSELQPIFFDSDPGSNYSKVLVDTVIIQGANPTVPLKVQFAGVIADSRISNASFPVQNMAIRQDLLLPLVAFSPTNVRIHNFDVSGVDYLAPGISVTYKSSNGNVANPADISSELNAIPGLLGVRFSNIKVQ